MPSEASRKNINKPYINLLIYGIIAAALFYAFMALFAYFSLKNGISKSVYMPSGLVCGFVTGFLCGFAALRPLKQKGALYGLISGLVHAFTSCIVLFAVNGASAGRGIFILFCVIVVSSVAGGISSVNLKPRKKY